MLYTLLFRNSGLSIRFFRYARRAFTMVGDRLLYLRCVYSIRVNAVRFPSSIRRVVDLVGRGGMFSKDALPRGSFRVGVKVGCVVVVASRDIRPSYRVRARFGKARLPFLHVFRRDVPIVTILHNPRFGGDVVRSIRVSSHPRAILEVTFYFVTRT